MPRPRTRCKAKKGMATGSGGHRREEVGATHPVMATAAAAADDAPAAAKWSLLRAELRSQLAIANPTILSMVLYKLPWMYSLHFVAQLGSDELAAAALATTICNVTGLSFAVGLSFGLSTLVGQARGDLLKRGEEVVARRMRREEKRCRCEDVERSGGEEEEKKESDESEPLLLVQARSASKYSSMPPAYYVEEYLDATALSVSDGGKSPSDEMPIQPLVFLFRGLLVQLLFVVPIGLWWMRGIEPALLALGQGGKLSEMTEAYLRVLSPGLWCYSVNFTFTSWLQAVDMANVPAYAALAGFLLHVPFNLLFVNVLGYGYLGVGMATVAFQLLQPVLVCAYLFGTSSGRERMLEKTGAKGIGRTRLSVRREAGRALRSLSGMGDYLSLALPGIVVISEWWASEVCIFLAGRLSPDPAYALGAMSIYQSINSFCFMFPIGFSSAASARVGMFLGKADAAGAKLASHVSVAGAAVLSGALGLALALTPHGFFPRLFTSDSSVVSETASTVPFLAVYVFADGVQTTLNGILKGCGMQKIAMPIVIVSYWLVGVPLAYYNAFIRHGGVTECEDSELCGTAGLVAGMTVGTWTHFVLLLMTVLGAIDFRKQAVNAQQRVSLEMESTR